MAAYCTEVQPAAIFCGFLVNVKETPPKATEYLTSEGHRFEAMADQATAGMKPKRVNALIQRGALR
jgi:hypothetical protein